MHNIASRLFPQTLVRRAALVVLVGAASLVLRWQEVNVMPPDLIATAPSALMPTVHGPNAAHFYAAAADAITLPPRDALNDYDFPNLSNGIRDAVDDNGEALALLREGFAYKYQGGLTRWMKSLPASDLSAPSPDYVERRTMARLLIADARVKAERGDNAGAVSASLDAVRFGQDIAHGSTLIDGMVGILSENIGAGEALRHVNGLSAAEARAAAGRLEELMTHEPNFVGIVIAEKQFGMGALRELFDPARKPSFCLSWGTTDGPPTGLTYDVVILRYGKDGIVRDLTTAYEDQERRAARPYQMASRLGDAPPPADPLARVLYPNFGRARLSATRREARKRVLLARLALRAYSVDHGGAVPKSLIELTFGPAHYLTAVPNDPFSESGNDALHYANGAVWTVGPDGHDNHGAGDDEPLRWE